MIKDINIFIILAVVAIAILLLISLGGNIYLHGREAVQDAENVKKLSVYIKTTAFVLFLIIGFSAVPIMVKFFTDALPDIIKESSIPKILQENAMNIVYGFWVVYVLGLLVAFPAMQKSGFFAPELPEGFKDSPSQTAPKGALPPIEYQINASPIIFLAKTEINNGQIMFHIEEVWVQTIPDKTLVQNTSVSIETGIFELLGYKPKNGQEVVFFFHKEGIPLKKPLEILPVQEGKITYGPTDPTVTKILTKEELKQKVQSYNPSI